MEKAEVDGLLGAPDRSREQGRRDYALLLFLYNSGARATEAARVAMTRFVARGGKIWTRVFPDKPITKKPQETRMGKGKGAPEQWVAVVRPGKVLFEMEGVSESTAREAMALAAHKLPIPTKFVARHAEGLP